MRVPQAIIWGCTKNWSATKVQPKGARSRNECFNDSPMNLTNLHNQSACSSAFGLVSVKAESKSKKASRNDYVLKLAHKSRSGAGKNGSRVVKDQWKSAKNAVSNVTIKKGTKHAAKTL